MIRCRLRTAWSFQAKALFWGGLGLELLLIGLAAHWTPWLWLGAFDVVCFRVVSPTRKAQSAKLDRDLLSWDDVAKHWGMTKLPPERATDDAL